MVKVVDGAGARTRRLFEVFEVAMLNSLACKTFVGQHNLLTGNGKGALHGAELAFSATNGACLCRSAFGCYFADGLPHA